MSPGAHQWLVNPAAIAVRPVAGATTCSELKCHLAAKYQVAFPRQAPSRYCPRHTRANIHRAIAIRKPVNLEKMIEATQQMDGQVRRIGYGKRSHIHWPEGGHTDEQMAEVDNATVRRDKTLCKVYVAVKHMAREKAEVTCPKCQRC